MSKPALPKGGSATAPPANARPVVGASLRDQLAINFMGQLMAPMYGRGVSPRITAQLAKQYADNLVAVLAEEEQQ